MSVAQAIDGEQGIDDEVADRVESMVVRHPLLEQVTRIGWVAKGVVYALMGVLAVSIARSTPQSEDASPEGALSIVMDQPYGRALLAALAVGLVLYSLWRLFSVALVRGTDVDAWLHRVGYGFSAAFYGVLAWTAVRSVLAGHDPERSSTVERLSADLLGSGLGRVLLLAAGIVTIGVGAYFAIEGVRRTLMDDLDTAGVSPAEHRLLTVLGVTGHVGRGVVTGLVGLFVTIASVTADARDARGFDRSLRHVADGGSSSALVLAAAVGLVLYGLFCLFSLPRRRLS